MTLKRGSSVAGSMRTRSIAPGAARWPQLICAPSNAGPVGLEQASSRSRLPSTISALVPTSTSRRDFRAQVRTLREDHAGRVGADVPGDARQDVDAGIGVHGEPERGGAKRQRMVDGEGKRRAAEFRRVDAEHQVMHDRVADQRQLEDVLGLDLRRRFASSTASALNASRIASVICCAPPGFIIA